MKNKSLLYTGNDGKESIEMFLENETFWLTQKGLADLFAVEPHVIRNHLSRIFESGELQRTTNISERAVVQNIGSRQVKRTILLYNHEVIYSIGYRINSDQAVKFRAWATNFIKSENLPLVFTEGKTDQKILSVAWEKLYPERNIPFEVKASGIQIDENSRTGNAEAVRRAIEYLSTSTNRTIIGLFDNDREGREQFKGLNKLIFEPYIPSKDIRKHLTKNIYGLCLIVPANRAKFITHTSTKHRYFEIEHYFSDAVLEKYNMKGENILDTEVFEISGDKSVFAEDCKNLASAEFENFRILFNEIGSLIPDFDKMLTNIASI